MKKQKYNSINISHVCLTGGLIATGIISYGCILNTINGLNKNQTNSKIKIPKGKFMATYDPEMEDDDSDDVISDDDLFDDIDIMD